MVNMSSAFIFMLGRLSEICFQMCLDDEKIIVKLIVFNGYETFCDCKQWLDCVYDPLNLDYEQFVHSKYPIQMKKESVT